MSRRTFPLPAYENEAIQIYHQSQIFKPVACRRVSNGRLSTREMHWRSVIPLLHIQENTSHGGSTNGGLALVFPFQIVQTGRVDVVH